MVITIYTINQLAKELNLSRSTLLYYDSIGLLNPSFRSTANYRQYSDQDRQRLEQICTYRKVGLTLKEISNILDASASVAALILQKRLEELNKEIGWLRKQQQVIVKLLENRVIQSQVRVFNEKAWVSLLRSIGLTDIDMQQWHQEFERLSPETHQDFLESLGISSEEITKIRKSAGAVTL